MIRVTIEVLPPEGERRVIETIEIVNLCETPNEPGQHCYRVERKACGGRLPSLISCVYHHPADGALLLVAKACEAVRR